jgi:hypothetical protein
MVMVVEMSGVCKAKYVPGREGEKELASGGKRVAECRTMMIC